MATYVSNSAGDWNTTTIWTPNGLPASGDDAQISHDVTISAANHTIDNLTVDAGKTLTLSGGYDLTALQGVLLGTGNIAIGAGSDLKWNVTGDVDWGAVNITSRGTGWGAGNFCTIENVHATGYINAYSKAGDIDLEYTALIGIKRHFSTGGLVRFVNCDVQCAPVAGYAYFRLIDDAVIEGSWFDYQDSIYGMLSTGYGASSLHLTNVTIGENRAGTAAGTATHCFACRNYSSYIYVNGLRNLATNLANWGLTAASSRIVVDNYNYNPLHTNGSGTGTPGAWLTASPYWTVERSVTHPYSTETYHARVTPASGCGDRTDKSADIDIYVPIQTGDNADVSVYGYNFGLTVGACAEVVIDPEGAWYTTATGEPSWTDSTWVNANPTASNASGLSDKGSLHIVLRVKDYAASSYFDWSAVTATVGGITYTISMQQGQHGMPIPDEPAGGGDAWPYKRARRLG